QHPIPARDHRRLQQRPIRLIRNKDLGPSLGRGPLPPAANSHYNQRQQRHGKGHRSQPHPAAQPRLTASRADQPPLRSPTPPRAPATSRADPQQHAPPTPRPQSPNTYKPRDSTPTEAH